ncbi:protein phosphatase [Pseudohyphozyma bogoriensis]|nr:protein phosphatase [Pseudohyphozyma bogoriensis]
MTTESTEAEKNSLDTTPSPSSSTIVPPAGPGSDSKGPPPGEPSSNSRATTTVKPAASTSNGASLRGEKARAKDKGKKKASWWTCVPCFGAGGAFDDDRPARVPAADKLSEKEKGGATEGAAPVPIAVVTPTPLGAVEDRIEGGDAAAGTGAGAPAGQAGGLTPEEEKAREESKAASAAASTSTGAPGVSTSTSPATPPLGSITSPPNSQDDGTKGIITSAPEPGTIRSLLNSPALNSGGGFPGMEEEEEEEDDVVARGGMGIPLDEDGNPRPLLGELVEGMEGRKCLVLDLDETLVHSSFKRMSFPADFVIPVMIENQSHVVYVLKRPGVDDFLKAMGLLYEIVIFTASLSLYADAVLDQLDIHGVISERLFRENCCHHKGIYVKDLSQLGRKMEDCIIIDNSPAAYIFHPNNAIPITTWYNDPHDTELLNLIPFLSDLAQVDDVRSVLNLALPPVATAADEGGISIP